MAPNSLQYPHVDILKLFAKRKWSDAHAQGDVQQVIDNGDMEPNELTNKAEKLRYYNVRCSKVSEVLYVGSDTVARDKQLLLENKITHVLNAAGVACKNYHEADGTFVYKTLHLFDSPREDISPMLYAAVEFIDAAIEGGGRVECVAKRGCV